MKDFDQNLFVFFTSYQLFNCFCGMRFTMSSDEKNTPTITSAPVYIAAPEGAKGKLTKKHVLIGLMLLVVLAIVIAAILIGMHIFSKSQMDLIKYTLDMSNGRRQDVEADKTNNFVKYHVSDNDHEAWIVADFNTDIRVTKIQTKTASNCYLSPLNRSNLQEPKKIIQPNTNTPEGHESTSLVFTTGSNPVQDISFLNKEARDMCNGVSTYWMYPSCANDDLLPTNFNKTRGNKREAPYYVQSTNVSGGVTNVTPLLTPDAWVSNGVTYPCINGCCKTVCSCSISYTYYWSGTRMYCIWVTPNYCFRIIFCAATPGLDCTSYTC